MSETFTVTLQGFRRTHENTECIPRNEGYVYISDHDSTMCIYKEGKYWTHITEEYQPDNPTATALRELLIAAYKIGGDIKNIEVTFQHDADCSMYQVTNFFIKQEPKPKREPVDPALYLSIEMFGIF